ncbi:MAG: hypothetical protein JSS49_07265 [Planctomycetes bacterium]|nr:hypothetical protein [Planctomycetota bacterium]
MTRIFLPLASLSTVTLIIAMALGLSIDDPKVATSAVQAGVQYHFLTALSALCFATLVHAIVLTYFMGTGRWIEETSNAYRLPATFFQRNQSIKYRTIPAMVGAFLLLLLTGALGAAADPAAPLKFAGWFNITPDKIHLSVAIVSVVVNIAVNFLEFSALERNGDIVDEVLVEVKRIRLEKGLAV